MPVILPLNFAAFANDLVSEAQVAAGLTVENILTPANETVTALYASPESQNAKLGLFIWRIGKDLMWQQLDRRIDEYAILGFPAIHHSPLMQNIRGPVCIPSH